MSRTSTRFHTATATISPARRVALLAALLATLPAAVATQAQEAPARPRPSPIDMQPQKKMPTLGCCRCLGEKNTLDLSTTPGNPWQVNGVPAAMVTSPNPAWSTNTGGAKWISINAAANGGANTTYRYTLRFKVEKCTIPQTIVLKGLAVAADNRYSVSLTGPSGTIGPSVPCPAAPASTGHCFTAVPGQLNNFAAWPITFLPGIYSLNVDVTNISGPTGMFINAVAEGQCTKDSVQPEKP
jgi:hypothetical protein